METSALSERLLQRRVCFLVHVCWRAMWIDHFRVAWLWHQRWVFFLFLSLLGPWWVSYARKSVVFNWLWSSLKPYQSVFLVFSLMNISFNATNQDINKRITTKTLINTIQIIKPLPTISININSIGKHQKWYNNVLLDNAVIWWEVIIYNYFYGKVVMICVL